METKKPNAKPPASQGTKPSTTSPANNKQAKAPQGAETKPEPRDQFGFGVVTLNHQFGKMLQQEDG